MISAIVETTAQPDWQTIALAAGTGALGYLLFVCTNPSASAFRDGLRVLRRHPRMWLWLASLSCAYVLFQIAKDYGLGEVSFTGDQFLNWPEFQPPSWPEAAQRSWLNALELVAGIFNQAIVSFPASALAALLFLLNWRGSQFRLATTARRRFGTWWLAAYLLLLLCAIAALIKPAFALGICWLNRTLDGAFLLRIGALIDWFSFQFEYLFGWLVQIYLILLTVAWIRGIDPPPERVFALALNRSVCAAKWAFFILLVTTCLIHMPLLITYTWIWEQTDFTKTVVDYVDHIARPMLSLGLILFCSVQVSLVLRNESLNFALGEHRVLLTRHWYKIFWFVLIVAVHFFLISCADSIFVGGFNLATIPGFVGTVFFAGLKAASAAWFLAAWVCLFRALQSTNSIRF